jgi:hypothetical protein|tara:strand:- start:437 stop:952 length:516 start_codon:yes stop_codon:yes gene_type:complete
MTIKKLDVLSVDFDWIISLKHQEELLRYIIPIVYKHNNIHLGYTHDKIYPIFEHGYDEYNIYNIDHHHDFGYEKFQSVDEGNWLFHLANVFTHKINYTWISNPTSDHVYWINTKMHKLKSFMFDHNINYIRETNFDKIFLCCSPDHAIAKEAVVAYKIVESIVNENKKSES